MDGSDDVNSAVCAGSNSIFVSFSKLVTDYDVGRQTSESNFYSFLFWVSIKYVSCEPYIKAAASLGNGSKLSSFIHYANLFTVFREETREVT